MALWDTLVFHNYRDMQDHLNGVLISPVMAPTDGLDVDGLALIIDAGGGSQTVSFAAAKNRPWTMTEIVAKIEATHASLQGVATRLLIGTDRPMAGDPGRSRLRLVADGGVIVRGNGTANNVFGWDEGLSPADDTVGAPILLANIHSVHHQIEEQDTWYVLVNA